MSTRFGSAIALWAAGAVSVLAGSALAAASASGSGSIALPIGSFHPAVPGASAPVTLDGPGGQRFELLVESRTEHGPVGDAREPLSEQAEGVTLTGRVAGGGSFVLATVGDGAWGALWTPEGNFEIQGAERLDEHGDPLAIVVPVPGDLPACAGGLSVAGAEPGPGAFDDAGLHAGARLGGDTVTRAFVVFTTNALPRIGGSGNVPSFALAAIESANQAYENSGINPLRLELAGFSVEPTPPDTGASATLRYATGRGEGYLDEGQALREAYSADIMPVIADISGACGVAWLNPDNDLFSSFSITDPACAIGNLTFAHEVGHNFGAAHDPDNAGGAYTAYAYGHRWNTSQGQFRSVMAYSPGSRVPHFSSPNVDFLDVATGIANQRDNARLHNFSQGVLSNYRSGPGDLTDCDASGTPDAVEIAAGAARDDNRNGVPDACDIAASPSLDCDADGVLDAFQARPRVDRSTLPVGPVDNTRDAQTRLSGLPEADATVRLTMVGHGDLGRGDEVLTLEVGNGGPAYELFGAASGDCYAPHEIETVQLSASAFNSLLVDGALDLSLSASSQVDEGVCSIPTQVTFRLEYRAADAGADADGDGVLDVCAVCEADYDASGAVDVLDVIGFIFVWNSGDPIADFNGDGAVNVVDVIAFIQVWNAGCP